MDAISGQARRTVAPISTRQNRDAGVELLRYIGAVGIVWFHLDGPSAWIGHAALAVFIVFSVYYTLVREDTDNTAQSAWSRTWVLEVWIFWSATYGLLKVVQALSTGQPLSSEFKAWMVLTGPSLPLWFLPFIYVMNGIASSYARRVRTPMPWLEGLGLAIGSLGCLLVLEGGPGIPLAQWSLGTASAFAAVAVFRTRRGGNYKQLALWFATIVGAVVLGGVEVGWLLLLAVPVAAVAVLFPTGYSAEWALRLGGASLAVYVLHSGVAAVLGILVPDLGNLTEVVTVVALSTSLGLALRSTPHVGRFI